MTKNKDIITVNTQGLDESVYCAMCTNTFKSNNGCDGNCIVDEDMYKKVMNTIKNHTIKTELKEEELLKQLFPIGTVVVYNKQLIEKLDKIYILKKLKSKDLVDSYLIKERKDK